MNSWPEFLSIDEIRNSGLPSSQIQPILTASHIYRLWDLKKFQALPFYRLWNLKLPLEPPRRDANNPSAGTIFRITFKKPDFFRNYTNSSLSFYDSLAKVKYEVYVSCLSSFAFKSRCLNKGEAQNLSKSQSFYKEGRLEIVPRRRGYI